MDVLNKTLEGLKDMDDIVIFKSIVGCLVDMWGAEHYISDKEILKTFGDLKVIQREVYDNCGRWEPLKGVENE